MPERPPHSLLRRQLKRHFGAARPAPEEWREFVETVNEAYHQFDEDRAMLERSLDLSSQELLEANAGLRQNEADLRRHHDRLGEMVRERTARLTRMNEELRQEVADRTRAEHKLAAARDQALESVRLKSAFLANMSHEIRTPLNIILGYSGLLDASDEAQRPLVEGIERAGKRLQETIDGILDISKIESGAFEVRPTWIELGTLIERQTRDFRTLAEQKGLSLLTVNSEPGAMVRCDAYCLTHALMNLLQNAVKFTETGSVAVELGRDELGRLCLRVRDTGIGIDPAFLPRLGQPFSQEDSSYTRRFEGSGLGIALTKKYLELNEASLSVESTKGTGTVFTIHFPAEAERRGSVAPARTGADLVRRMESKPTPDLEQPSVLVVEDDLATQGFMQTLLGRRFRVWLARSAGEAREQLAVRTVDLILMDLSLKGEEDGLMLTRELRLDPEWRDLPIIAVTAHAFEEDRAKVMEAGCDAFLPKPLRLDQLMTTMAALLGRGSGAPRSTLREPEKPQMNADRRA